MESKLETLSATTTTTLTERQKHLQHGKKREEFLANNSSVPHDRYCCPELVEEVRFMFMSRVVLLEKISKCNGSLWV